MLQQRGGATDRQTPFDAAVVVPTVLRPSLARAVASVYAQDLGVDRPGARIQLLIGIDHAAGESPLLDRLVAECPPHIGVSVFDPGYSTSARHGGLYPNRFSGALRTILSYAANSRYVAYLDDDNWWAPNHLATLLGAIADVDWAWSSRWFVEAETEETICVDDWESVGPDAGIFVEKFGGFVDPSSLMVDKFAAHDILPFWSLSPFEDGSGEDRLVFAGLKGALRGRGTGLATSYYTVNPADPMQSTRLQMMRERGFVLPSLRRAGVRTLTEVVPAAGGDEPAVHDAAAGCPEPDLLLSELAARLKPREIVVFGSAEAARSLAALARRHCPQAVTVAPCAADAALGLRALPAELDLGRLAAQGLAVDLVHLGRHSDAAGLVQLYRAAWPMLRPGGIVLAEVPTVGAIEDFSPFMVETGAKALPASLGVRHYWILEKP